MLVSFDPLLREGKRQTYNGITPDCFVPAQHSQDWRRSIRIPIQHHRVLRVSLEIGAVGSEPPRHGQWLGSNIVNAKESPEGYLLEHYFMTEKFGNVGK
jgi:hypothetical protein